VVSCKSVAVALGETITTAHVITYKRSIQPPASPKIHHLSTHSQHKLVLDCLLLLLLSSALMPLVRFPEDELCHIKSDHDATSISRWRASTSYMQRSSDLGSSLKSASWNPRFPSKPTSWTTAAQRVVRLEKVQEDEEGDDHSTYHPGLPQVSMETHVSNNFCRFIPWAYCVCSRIR